MKATASIIAVTLGLARTAHAQGLADPPEAQTPPLPAPDPSPAEAPPNRSAPTPDPSPAEAPSNRSAPMPDPSPAETPSNQSTPPPAPQYAPPPVQLEPVAPKDQNGVPSQRPKRRRSGLFAEAALGPGMFYGATAAEDSRTFVSGSVALQAALGGTVARGFVLGGAYFRDQLFAMSASDEIEDGDEPNLDDVGFSLDRVGVFAEYFPSDGNGVRFQGFVGLGTLNTYRPEALDADDPSGGVVSLGGGYGWMVGDDLVLGAMLRLTYAALRSNETRQSEDRLRAFFPTLLFGAAYH